MAITIVESGDIFESKTQTIVNTVNCVGVMGKGIASQFKQLYPQMFREYVELCEQNLIDIGKLWIYKTESRWILNFPTKKDWRSPSRETYLIEGLEKFVLTYKRKGITSISFPLLGSSNGKIKPQVSLDIMKTYLERCDIPVCIYLRPPRSLNRELFETYDRA